MKANFSEMLPKPKKRKIRPLDDILSDIGKVEQEIKAEENKNRMTVAPQYLGGLGLPMPKKSRDALSLLEQKKDALTMELESAKSFYNKSRESENKLKENLEKLHKRSDVIANKERQATMSELADSFYNPSIGYATPNKADTFKEEKENRKKVLENRFALKELQKARYESYPRQEDFGLLSMPKNRAEDKDYEFINALGDYKGNEPLRQMATMHDEKRHAYYQMTDKEKAVYNYLYAKEGKEKANEYLGEMLEELNERAGKSIAKNVGDNTFLKLAMSPGIGLEGARTGMKQNFSEDKALVRSPMEYAGQEMRGSLSGLSGVAYDTGQTIGNMAPAILGSIATGNPYAGLIMTGASAKGNAQNWALKEGYSPNEAAIYGTVIGVSEATLQKVLGGISNLGGGGAIMKGLSGKINAIQNGVLRFLSKYGVSALSEGFEEGLQEVLEPVIKTAVLGEEYTPAKVEDVMYSALLGAISSGIFEGQSIAVEEIANRSLGKKVSKEGETEAVVKAGLNLAPDTTGYSVAKKIGERLAQKKKANLGSLGILANEVNEATERGEATAEERIQKIGEALNRKVMYYEPNNSAENGLYKDGIIYINPKSGNPISAIFSHELTHSIEMAESYKDLSDRVFARLGKDADNLIRAKVETYSRNGVNLTTEEAKAEVVAEFVEKNLFANEQEVKTLVRENRTVAERVYEWIKNTIHKIGAKLGNKKSQEIVFLENAREVYRQALGGNSKSSADSSFLIRNDGLYGGKYVEIDKDILDKVPKKQWKNATESYLKTQYPNGIIIGGQKLEVNAKTTGKAKFSKYAEHLKKYEKNKYKDRMKAYGNLDELVSATGEYVNEGLYKPRKDFQSFSKASVLIKVDQKEYVANIIVGLKKNGEAVLYEITDMNEVSILKNKKNTSTTASATSGNTAYSSGVSNQTIPQSAGNVNPQYSISEYSDNSVVTDKEVELAKEMLREDRKTPSFIEAEREYRKNKELKAGYSIYDEIYDLYSDDIMQIARDMADGDIKGISFEGLSDESKNYIRKQRDILRRRMRKYLGIHKYLDTEKIDSAIDSIIKTYIEKGEVSRGAVNKAFDTMIKEATKKSDEYYQMYKELKRELRTIPLKISDQDKADIPGFNRFETFRKKTFGILSLKKDGFSVDTIYSALVKHYPDLFPEDITHPADQLYQIYEVAKSIKVSENMLDDTINNSDFMEIREGEFKLAVKDMLSSLRRIERYEVDADLGRVQEKRRADSKNAGNHLREAKKELSKLKSRKKELVKRYVLSKDEQIMAADFAEGKITRDMVKERTGKSEHVIVLAVTEGKIAKKMKEVHYYQSKVDNQKAVLEKEAKKLRQEWLNKPIETYKDWEKIWTQKRELMKKRDEITGKLSDNDKAIYNGLVKGEYDFLKVVAEANKHENVYAAYELEREIKLFDLKIRKNQKEINRKYAAEAIKDTKNFQSWKDKKFGLSYTRETAIRNIYDVIPDKVEAARIENKYFYNISRQVAKMNKFKEEFSKEIREMNISRKIEEGNAASESYLIHFIGDVREEIKRISEMEDPTEKDKKRLYALEMALSEMMTSNPNIDMERIEKAIVLLREAYDKLYSLINKAYIDIGSEPMPFRKGYFPHFQKDDLVPDDMVLEQKRDMETLRKLLEDDSRIPTSIVGNTENFKPNSTYFAHRKERTGSRTDYDALYSFDVYLNTSAEIIYLSKNIKSLRYFEMVLRARAEGRNEKDLAKNLTKEDREKMEKAFAESVEKIIDPEMEDDKKQELFSNERNKAGAMHLNRFVSWLQNYSNHLANKRTALDRVIVSATNEAILRAGNTIAKRIGVNMVVGNLGAALTNIIPLTDIAGEVSMENLAWGMLETLKALKTGDNSFTEKSVFLTNRKGYENLAETSMGKFAKKLNAVMDFIDTFVSNSIVRARYIQNVNNGMSESAAIDEADRFTMSVMAGRSKGEMPLVFANKNLITKMVTMFRLEVNNHLSYLLKDVPRMHREEEKSKLMLRFLQVFLAHYLINQFFEYLRGSRAALDPIGILNDAIGDFTGYKVPNLLYAAEDIVTGKGLSFKTNKLKTNDALYGLSGEIAKEVPFVGSFIGGGRIPISAAVPNFKKTFDTIFNENKGLESKLSVLKEEMVKPIFYIAAPAGGNQLKKTLTGIVSAAQKASYTVDREDKKAMRFPVTDPMKAVVFGEYSQREAQDYVKRGFRPLNNEQTYAYEDLLKTGMDRREAYQTILEIAKSKNGKKKREAIRDLDVTGEQKQSLYSSFDKSEDERDTMFLWHAKEEGADMKTITDGLISLKGTKGKEKRLVLLNMDASDKEKELLLRHLGTDKEITTAKAFKEMGLTTNDYLESMERLAAANAEDDKDYLLFADWLDKKDYSKKQKDFVAETLDMKVKIAPYQRLLDAGIKEDVSRKIFKEVSTMRRYHDKVDKILSMGLEKSDLKKALISYAGKEDKKKLEEVFNELVSPKSFFAYQEAMALNKGSENREKAEEIIEALPIPKYEKAVLWQLHNKDWKGFQNPFDKKVGLAIEEKRKRKEFGEKFKKKNKK